MALFILENLTYSKVIKIFSFISSNIIIVLNIEFFSTSQLYFGAGVENWSMSTFIK